jgi:hypothetical protein
MVMSNKRWTKEEIEYLSENWGHLSIGAISKKLNRTIDSVIVKKDRLKLGAFLNNGNYITFNQLTYVLGRRNSNVYMMTSWVKNRNFTVKTKKVGNRKFNIVYISDFWQWAEKNRSFIDFSKVEENILGPEPKWVKEQRKADSIKNTKIITTPWTQNEDSYLQSLLRMFKYTYAELSKMLHRSEGAIQRRIICLGLKERPLRESTRSTWEEWQLEKLNKCIDSGCGYEIMSELIGKSAKAIRGKVYGLYGTENLDKVRSKKESVEKVS